MQKLKAGNLLYLADRTVCAGPSLSSDKFRDEAPNDERSDRSGTETAGVIDIIHRHGSFPSLELANLTLLACQTRGGPTLPVTFAPGTLAKDVLLQCSSGTNRPEWRVARGAVDACAPHVGTISRAASFASPESTATRRWLRASCSTLALAWLASRIGRLPLLLAQAWRGSTLWASRRWALSIAGSLPTGSRLGGANKRSRSSRRGRGWSNPTGCVVAATLPFIVGCQASARRWCCARVRLLSLDVASMTSWSWLVSLAPRGGAREDRQGREVARKIWVGRMAIYYEGFAFGLVCRPVLTVVRCDPGRGSALLCAMRSQELLCRSPTFVARGCVAAVSYGEKRVVIAMASLPPFPSSAAACSH